MKVDKYLGVHNIPNPVGYFGPPLVAILDFAGGGVLQVVSESFGAARMVFIFILFLMGSESNLSFKHFWKIKTPPRF